jgi:hypothetical protein
MNFLSVMFIPTSFGEDFEPKELWGIGIDDSNTYLLKETNQTTDLTLVEEFPTQTYRIIGLYNYDNDSNGYPDINMLFQTKKNADLFRWFPFYNDSFAFNQSELLINMTYEIEDIIAIHPILPIHVNESSGQGFNWTKSIGEINDLEGYNTSISLNILTIEFEIEKESYTPNNYTLIGKIQWDMHTGWLYSYEVTEEFQELDYSLTLTIEIFTSSSIIIIDWGFIITCISLTIGIAGLIFALWAIQRSSKMKKEDNKPSEIE